MDVEQQILAAIKADNIEEFSKFISQKRGYLSLCYGRFPVLSICYLYKSSKIIKEHQRALSTITVYTYTDEDFDVYKKFKEYAKRCLRLYRAEKSIVSPLEMLAILEDSVYLTEVYDVLSKNQTIVDNIAEIYQINHSQTIEQSKDEIIIKKKRLSRFQKIFIVTAIIVASIMIFISSSLWITFETVLGRGSSEKPYKVYTERQLTTAMKSSKSYILAKDITLESTWQRIDFSGALNGNGHSIYVGDKINNGMINELSGSLLNIKFVFSDLDIAFTKKKGFITQINNGVIDDVHIDVKGNFTEDNEEENIYVSFLAYENNGEIKSSSINGDITFIGNGSKDVYFSGIASINKGTITDCFTTEKSKFITDTVDVAGLVTENGEEGIVKGCVNNAEIKQQSASNSWLPNASGVVLINNGEINECLNNGNITGISTAEESKLDVYVGGIVCVNLNSVIKCKNNANIIANTENYNIYAGGIVSLNNINYATVNNSCSYGEISIFSHITENVFLFAGGIAGRSTGRVVNSYSASKVTTTNEDNENAYLGGIFGTFDYNTAFSQNNYYVEQDNIDYGIASVLVYDYFENRYIIYRGPGEEDTGVTKQTDLEQLKGKEVYWG